MEPDEETTMEYEAPANAQVTSIAPGGNAGGELTSQADSSGIKATTPARMRIPFPLYSVSLCC